MWFGYFNRNHEEALDVPIGPDNRFEPGAADRGQPTHFVPQWQKSSFRIVVPKDFGQQKITWRLTSKGKTETVVAALDPRSISVITFAPSTALLQDGKSATTATFSEPGEYVIQGVVDDGSLLAGTYCCWVSREVRVTVD
jgi:hypothetical protein